MFAALILWLAGSSLAAQPPAPPVAASPVAVPGQPEVSDDLLVKRWKRLKQPERLDVLDRFGAEVEALDTLQGRLIRHALKLDDRAPGFLPDEEEIPFYDPTVHAADDPIRRKRIKPTASSAKKELASILGRHAPRAFVGAWRYDWAQREVVRRVDLDANELETAERVLRNALAGVPPGLDLAEAQLLRALDDGAQQPALAAFAHAYTDRKGNVYPGLTLYDAWTSGRKMEMPDVDNLGVVHDLLDQWTRWVSPVPSSKHKSLYNTVAKLFAPAHNHRALRTAFARAYLQGEPALRDGYDFQLDRLHAVWDELRSDPAALAAELPEAEGVREYMAEHAARLESDPELIGAGRARRETLKADQARVRELMLTILAEAGVDVD